MRLALKLLSAALLFAVICAGLYLEYVWGGR